MERLKNKSGITLIALVITILVLLILAGVAINLAIGERGLFNQTKLSVEKYKDAQDYENTEIAKATNEINSFVDGNRDTNSISTIKAYTAQNSDIVDSISLGSYNISEFDYILVTARCDSDSYATTSNIYCIDDLIIGTSSIRLDSDSNYTVYTIANDNTLTKHASSNQYYILSIRLIKL